MVRPISGVKTELQVPALLDCGEEAVREERLGRDRGSLVTVTPDLPGHQAEAQKTLLQFKWQRWNESPWVPGSVPALFHRHQLSLPPASKHSLL